MTDKIFIILTFDIDNDPVPNLRSPDPKNNPLSWNGIDRGIPEIISAISECSSGNTPDIPTTWFVRCDNQLKEIYGDEGYLLDEYRSVWNSLRKMHAEIAWHAHLYKWKDQAWIQETDKDMLASNLQRGYKKMVEKKYSPVSARIGESYMSNGIMSSLDALGIRIESTAMPGRVRKDEKFSIDWDGTPSVPYYPSKQNYRKPGHDPLGILEMPMSMIPTQVEYDKTPLMRYVNMGFRHSVIRNGLESFIHNSRVMVSITHPFEIIPPENAPDQKHPLLSFNIRDFSDNLRYIIAESKKARKECIFIRLKDVLEESVYEYIKQDTS